MAEKKTENPFPKDIKDILIRESYVAEKDVKEAEENAKKNRTSIIEYLLSNELITERLLGQAVAESYNVPFADLEYNPPSKEDVLRIPEETAQKYQVVLFSKDRNSTTVATANPAAEGLKTSLKKILKGDIKIAYGLRKEVKNLFVHYRKPLETRFAKIIQEQKKVAPEIIEEIIEDALAYRASDIHLEPRENRVVVRFRIDGVLHEAGEIPKDQYGNILNRVKVQARMRIDEHFTAQDGAMRYTTNETTIDMRISVIPTLDGEKIAIRILSEYVRRFTLGELGLSDKNQETFLKAARRPFGMILTVGPTGSGKTTTLYALLSILNRPEVNITTIEDPVEYKIGSINQIQVNEQTKLTFADGLRSIIRQDPNIILVGEIRDQETAEIASNAALTGHLLLSTFHSNDAATSIPRLLDMGIEPFLLASTLELVIAQRLARKICLQCRYSVSTDPKEIKNSIPVEAFRDSKLPTAIYAGRGCEVCGDTGYHGRTALFELIKITPEMHGLILKNPASNQIRELADEQGFSTMFDDGVDKVERGIITIAELMRVAPPV